MTEHATKLIHYLSAQYTKIGFGKISIEPNYLPDKISWIGGIEKKTFNLHRVVCIVEYLGGITSFNPSIIVLKDSLHSFLNAKFWRGLGIGLIVYSHDIIDDELLRTSVYTAEKVSTSLIQWIINLSLRSNSAKVAQTFSEVSTTFMVNEILDFIEIPVDTRKVLVAEQVSLLKMKLN